MKQLLQQRQRVQTCSEQLFQTQNKLNEHQHKLKQQTEGFYEIITTFPGILALLTSAVIFGAYLAQKPNLISKRRILKLYSIFNFFKGW